MWDCRPQRRIPSDSHAAPGTHFDLGCLESRLRHYPDQYLAANILKGIRLDGDVELQSVWVPLLTSLPSGHASVGEELRRLRPLGWYEFCSNLPFWPMYLSGQGATARRLKAGPLPAHHRRQRAARPHLRRARPPGHLHPRVVPHLPHAPALPARRRPEFETGPAPAVLASSGSRSANCR